MIITGLLSTDLNRFGLSMSVVVILRLTIVCSVVSLLDIGNERRFLGEILRNDWSDVDYDKDKYNR